MSGYELPTGTLSRPERKTALKQLGAPAYNESVGSNVHSSGVLSPPESLEAAPARGDADPYPLKLTEHERSILRRGPKGMAA